MSRADRDLNAMTASPSRLTPGHGRAPTADLPSRRAWLRTPIATAAVGGIVVNSLPLVGAPELAPAAMVAGAAVTVGSGMVGWRRQRRAELVAGLREALADGIGTIDPRAVHADRWWGRGVGTPGRLRISYVASMTDDDPMWREQLATVVRRRLQCDVTITAHDVRRRRLVLTLVPVLAAELEAETPAEVERVELVIASILGDSATVYTDLDQDAGLVQRVEVTYPTTAALANARARTRVENSISALLPGRWRFAWNLEADTLAFELRSELPTFAPHSPIPITSANERLLPFAIDENGEIVSWDLRGAHMLVAGRTGTGKTVLMRAPITEACRRQWMVLINDPKRVEYLGLIESQWPNVAMVATSVRDMIATIWHVHEEMERRYRAIEAGIDAHFTPILLVQDEYMNFCRKVLGYWASIKARGMPTKCPVFDWIFAILEMGRTADIHVLFGTQRPDASIFANGARDNFSVRASCGPLSPQGAMMMWDNAYKGVAVPRSIRGRGTAVNDDDIVADIQVLWTPDPRTATGADLEILAALRPETTTWPQMRIVYGGEHDIDGTEAGEWDQLLDSDLHTLDGKRLSTLGWHNVPAANLPRRVPADAAARPAPTPRRTPLRAVPDPAPGPELPDEDDGIRDEDHQPPGYDEDYGPERRLTATALEVGDLVLVDETTDQWAVVEYLAADDATGDGVCLSWIDDEGVTGNLAIDGDETVYSRRPLEPAGV